MPVLPRRPRLLSRVVRGGLAVAAAVLACAALLSTQVPRGIVGFDQIVAGEMIPRVVRRIDSPTARVVTLTPASPEAPIVTVIIDEEIDL